MKFEIGQLVITREINAKMNKDLGFCQFIFDSIVRYRNCDWGDIPNDDKKMNNNAVKNNDDRIVARYNNVYIITEWDRSVTTILFTHEY